MLFRNHEVRELEWVFRGPGLVCDQYYKDRVETDSSLSQRIEPFLDRIAELDRNPASFAEHLRMRPSGGRLGRHFENLLAYYLTDLKAVSQIAMNVQVRGPRGVTVGELDLVFKDEIEVPPVHWEASVKFYICTTTDEGESRDPKFFMGTLVHDRLDLKLTKLFERQLRLPETEPGDLALAKFGLRHPRSRAMMKGFFFYPSSTNWRERAHPDQVSPRHMRGWWTTARELIIPQTDADSRYIPLPFSRWFAPFSGLAEPYELSTLSELRARVNRLFDSSWARPINYEIMVAEVVIVDRGPEGTWITERSRGTIVMPRWPEHARDSLASVNS